MYIYISKYIYRYTHTQDDCFFSPCCSSESIWYMSRGVACFPWLMQPWWYLPFSYLFSKIVPRSLRSASLQPPPLIPLAKNWQACLHSTFSCVLPAYSSFSILSLNQFIWVSTCFALWQHSVLFIQRIFKRGKDYLSGCVSWCSHYRMFGLWNRWAGMQRECELLQLYFCFTLMNMKLIDV